MERIYVKHTGSNVTFMHRATHEILGFADMKEKKKVKDMFESFCELSTEDYIEKAISLGIRMKFDKHGSPETTNDQEEWYNKAWKRSTELLLKELNLPEDYIPEDKITAQLVEAIRKGNREPKRTVESKKTKAVKKVAKKTNKPAPEETKKEYTEEELRKLFTDKKITAQEYKEQRLALKNKTKKPVPKKKK